jgi:hypothetical protein
MITEIAQIKRFLAKRYGLDLEGDSDLTLRVVGSVPPGEHIIPLGVKKIPHRVTISAEETIRIGDEWKRPTLTETQEKVLKLVAKSLNGQRQIAGHGMGPYLSAARALVRKGLLGSYQTGHFYITDEGKAAAK